MIQENIYLGAFNVQYNALEMTITTSIATERCLFVKVCTDLLILKANTNSFLIKCVFIHKVADFMKKIDYLGLNHSLLIQFSSDP